MKIKSIDIRISQIICLAIYYGFAKHLPHSGFLIFGGGSKWLRYQLVRRIFKVCGKNVNIEHGASFGSGRNISIGDNSGIGINADIPGNTIIGKNVMMGPNCYIAYNNHIFSSIDTPICEQGMSAPKETVIEDDVWIGKDVKMTVGRHISRGSIIALGCVLTKDFPPFSIVGGNPGRLIKSRI